MVKVTELETLFQKQHETGYWEMEALSLLHLDMEAVARVLEEAGSKSLGGYICMSLASGASPPSCVNRLIFLYMYLCDSHCLYIP